MNEEKRNLEVTFLCIHFRILFNLTNLKRIIGGGMVGWTRRKRKEKKIENVGRTICGLGLLHIKKRKEKKIEKVEQYRQRIISKKRKEIMLCVNNCLYIIVIIRA